MFVGDDMWKSLMKEIIASRKQRSTLTSGERIPRFSLNPNSIKSGWISFAI
jgi:hypothetical protein